MRVNGVIVAAGKGKRMGGKVSKPLLPLCGRAVVLHALSRFAASQVRKLVLVTPEPDISKYQELVRSDSQLGDLEFVFQAGGPRRQDSVSHGLERLDPDCEVVIIHDGVRPFISPQLIDRCVEAAFREGAVVVGVPVRDTIKVISADRQVKETPPRDSLWEIQTPQAFRTEVIREAFQKAVQGGAEATDDAVLVERLGRRVALLEGQTTNIKITVPEDLVFAEALLRAGLVS
ncbi:MAG: 2-C-methyl-D-erythritol 4-phosphate cytidylyltransferase [Deltaproteobacteria bacterium]|nr:2-C-methyl-D-erythritol 4-phosphate cytidylyltransferase [Deltaproteobacteria bacterium]